MVGAFANDVTKYVKRLPREDLPLSCLAPLGRTQATKPLKSLALATPNEYRAVQSTERPRKNEVTVLSN